MKTRRLPEQPLATLDDAAAGGLSPRRRIATNPDVGGEVVLNMEGTIQTIRIADTVDSPYQPRLSYDPESIDELGRSLAANGQQEPVLVRPLPDGRWEFLSGHRRKRAALNIGWTDLTARIVTKTDEQAKRETLLQNEGREDLTEYERAKMYRTALDDGLVKNQMDCAEVFATSQATVSKTIAMLELPAPIIAMLEKKPSLFGASTAALIRDLLNDYPSNHDTVIQAVERLQDGASAASLRGWVAQMVANKTPSTRKHAKSVVTNRSGSPTYETRSKPDRREVTISLKDKTIDVEEFEQWIISELRKRQEQHEQ